MLRSWYSRLSLRTKATGISLAITMLSLAVVAVIGIAQIRQQIAAEQHRTADAIVLGVARAAELPLAVGDTKELSRVANSFLRDESVLFVAVYGKGSAPLASAVRDRGAWQAFQHGQVNNDRFVLGHREVDPATQREEFFDGADPDPLASPTDPDSKAAPHPAASAPTGRIFVGISTAQTQLAQQRQSRLTMLVAATAGVLGAAILFLTLGSWLRRLERLAESSQAIARGDFAGTVGDRHNDEIGRLAQSFDSMRVTLRDRDARLREFNQTLQDQVRKRTQDLQLALNTAEEANKAKSLFLANMSHELRTPLNGVIGMVDLMLAAKPDAQQRRYCDVAKGSAKQLLELINDILDFSKIEAGKLELDATDFDLHDVIEGMAQMHGERAEQKKLELICNIAPEIPHSVNGDPVRLRQVISNLLSNAIKFTERGEVQLEARVEKQTDADVFVQFTIRDSGIGIPPERLDRLFKSFSQVDASTTRKFGGTGLGLAISSRIVELMGGRIEVESANGKGSAFHFTARLHKRQPPIAPAPRFGLRGLRVIAVDDNNAATREILRSQLASWSMRADIAADAGEASRILFNDANIGEPFCLAIIDMNMPGDDGLRLAQDMRSYAATQNVALVGLCAMGQQIDARRKKLLGFSVCIPKPVLPSQLYNALVEALAASAAHPEETAPAAAPVDRAPPRAIRVLLVEDNEINRYVASELLAQMGCRVSMAVNGREGVTAALKDQHDVILMDCQMPVLDGFAATREIRLAEQTTGGNQHRPIIALTANAIKGDRELCLAAGMDAYLTKPINPEELMQTIRSFVPQGSAPTETQPLTPATPGSGVSPDVDPPVDLDTLQQRCLGNRKLAAMALRKFDSSVTNELLSLGDKVDRGDAKAVAAAAHKIKGAAANISAERVRRIVAQLETLALADELAQTRTYLDQLRGEMDQFRSYLSTALARLESAPEAKGCSDSEGSGVRV